MRFRGFEKHAVIAGIFPLIFATCNLAARSPQLDVNVGSSYDANIVRLNNTAALNDPALTRYGADGTQVPSQWVNAIAGFGDSASRYRLVASLVMQYQDSNFSGDYSEPFDQTYNASLSGSTASDLTARNEAIQRAI